MPRLGLTFSPRNSKTIVRGGYGLFYDWYDSNLYDQTLRVNGIAQRDLRINCPGYPDPFAPSPDAACQAGLGAGVPTVQPGGRIQASPDLKMPHVHQASVSIERPITANLRTTVGYQTLRGRNQMRARDINTPDPITGLRPEPTIGSVTQFESTGRSVRDSLNVNIGYAIPRRQMNLGMNYTLAQYKNHADNPTQLPVDSYDPDAEWGPSSQDIRHRLQANLFLPPVFGLRATVNGLVYQSAAPYNITTGRDDNHDLVINDRPLDASGKVIGRNSARGSARWGDLSMRLGRGFSFGTSPGQRRRSSRRRRGGPGPAGRTRRRWRRRPRRCSAGQRALQSRTVRAGRQRPQPCEFHQLRGDDDVAAVRTADRLVAGAAGAGRNELPVLIGSGGSGPQHARGRDVADRRRAHLAHRQRQFRAQDVEHPLDAFLSERRQPPDIRTPDADRPRAGRQRLVDVRAAAEPSVDEHRNPPAHCVNHFGQAVDRRAQRFGGASAVIRHDEAVRRRARRRASHPRRRRSP